MATTETFIGRPLLPKEDGPGVEGIGETGMIAAPPAVMNAIVDAVSHLGVTHIEKPATAERVWRAIQDARAEDGRGGAA
jgi:carbon-monoxide dehydrogenase large subunit